MSRKKMRKNFANKTVEVSEDLNANKDNSLQTFIKILIAVSAVLLITFGILNTFMKVEEVPVVEETDYTDNLGYNKILAQDIFDKQEEEYLVFFTNGEEGKEEVNAYYDALANGTPNPKIYVVDMAEQVNASYLVDDSEEVEEFGTYASVEYNKEPASIEELEVYKFPTVIHLTDGEVVGYYENSEFYDVFGVTNPSTVQ